MKKTTQKPAKTGLRSWGAVLGLSLMTMQAPASTLITGQLEAGTPRDVVHELVEKLGYTESGPCTLVSLEREDEKFAREVFFRAECDSEKLFLKFDSWGVAQAFRPVVSLLESSPLLSRSVLKPIAEFSFRREGRESDPEDYCGAYPWIAGDTLEDLVGKVHQPEQEAEYLEGLYRQVGEVIGEMHRIGLVDADQPLPEMQSGLVHRDLHGGNVKITPDNRIVVLDIDSFVVPEKPQPVLEFVLDDVINLVVMVERNNFLTNSPRVSAWLSVLPGVAEAMLTSYCQTLVGKDKAAVCVSRIAEQLPERIEMEYQNAVNFLRERMEEGKAEGTEEQLDDEQWIESVASEQEIKCRLEVVLGLLR
ncbi:MAG: hypothetical protein OXC07_02130 [Kistimonas sp.]|nr:hypothetical protein [Kistimonas sp.]